MTYFILVPSLKYNDFFDGINDYLIIYYLFLIFILYIILNVYF